MAVRWLALVLVAFAAINARWLWLFRHGQPLDIDEAGYLSFSIVDYDAFVRQGFDGFLRAVWAPSNQAPITTALAALIFCLTGPHVIAGFAVPLIAGMATIAATYCLGARLGCRTFGLVCAALVASNPAIIMYSRSFLFALPATFFSVMALLALLKSDRLRSFGWAGAFGLCCGLLPLARTMTIAFVPGLFLAAGIHCMAEPADRRRRLANLAWSFLVAVGVAATWLVPSANQVFGYLMSFGYGAHAADYGPAASLVSLDRWLLIARYFAESVYLPNFFMFLTGGLLACVIACRTIIREGFEAGLQRVRRAAVLPIIVFVAAAFVALASSQNRGNGFYAPVVPAAIVLAVWAFDRFSRNRIYRTVVLGLAALVVLLGFVPSIDLTSRFAHPWVVEVPALGPVTVTDGRAYIQVYEAGGGFASGNPAEPIGAAAGRAWMAFNEASTAAIASLGGAKAATAFGFRHYLFNVNTVNLQRMLGGEPPIGLLQIDPVETHDSVSGTLAWLTTGSASAACILLTSRAETGQIQPVVNNDRVVEAAIRANFRPAGRWEMPNRQYVDVWLRHETDRRCGTDP